MPQTRTQARRTATLLTVIATIITLVMGGGVAAAVMTPGFTVTNILVADQTREKISPLTLDWSFDPAIGRAPLPGEGFELDIPARLTIVGDSQGTKPLIFDSKTVGSCTFGAKKITCTFNDGATQIADRTDVAGTISLQVSADGSFADAYTAPTIDFTFNGVTVPGSIPKGIGPRRVATYNASRFSKYSTPIGSRNTSIPWVVDFNPTQLSAAPESKGTLPTPDGNTVYSIEFTDVMGEGYDQDAINTSPWLLMWVSSSTDATSGQRVLANTNGVNPDPRFSITREGTGKARTIRITGPFEPETNYRMSLPSRLPGTALPGVEYTNTISINGTDHTKVGMRSYDDTARLSVRMKDGYGAVAILKGVRGAAAARVPAGSTFPVTLTYTLPEGKTPQDLPGWAPEIDPNLDPTANSGTIVVNAKVGVWTNYDYLFPEGTTIVVGENQPSIPDVNFDLTKSTFTPAQFTVGNRILTDVKVANIAEQTAQGEFKVSKTVVAPAGDNAFQAPATVQLNYTCGQATGTVAAPTDGSPVTVGSFPVGTECAITGETGDSVAGYTNAQNLGSPVTLVAGQAVANTITVTNTYTKDTVFVPFSVAKL